MEVSVVIKDDVVLLPIPIDFLSFRHWWGAYSVGIICFYFVTSYFGISVLAHLFWLWFPFQTGANCY